MPKRMRVLLEQFGLSGETHRSQPVTEELLSWADVVVTMANAHVKRIELQYPQYLDKLERWYVDDPHFSSDPAVHLRVVNEIIKLVQDRFCQSNS